MFFERFTNAAIGSGVTITAIDGLTTRAHPSTAGVVAVAAIALLGVISNDRKIVSSKIANDPARDDYDLRTLAQPIPLDLKPIAERHELGVLMAPAIQDLWRASLALDAHLRAYERSLGADEAGDERMSVERLEEARGWALSAAEALLGFSRSSIEAADRLEQLEPELPFRAGASLEIPFRVAPIDELLPLDVLGLIYRTGMPIRRLRVSATAGRVSSTPLIFFARALRDAGDQCAKFGHSLEVESALG